MKPFAIIALLLVPVYGLAQGTSTGEASLKFLYPARILSMGGAPIADTQNASASFANPACLATGRLIQVSFSQMQWIQDIQTQLLTASMPLSVGTAAIALSSTNVADIPIREVPGPALGSFTSHSTTIQLGYALNLTSDIDVGATAKYLYDKMYIDDASGYGLDVGVLYRGPIDGLSMAAAITNVGKMNAFRSQSTDLPTDVDIGADYTFSTGDFLFAGALALGQETGAGGTSEIRVGGEATYNDLLSVRVGYQTGYDVRGVSVGLGIHYSFVQLDYAYIPFSEGFGDANVITIGVNF